MSVGMAWTVLKIAAKAKSVPEGALGGRVVVGLVGGFVLIPVVSGLLDPATLSVTDYFGLAVFSAVGLWLVRAAIRGTGMT